MQLVAAKDDVNSRYNNKWISANGKFNNKYQEIKNYTENEDQGTVIGSAIIENPVPGKYRIYETSVDTEGYKLEHQTGYKSDDISRANGWVYLQEISVDGPKDSAYKFELTNTKSYQLTINKQDAENANEKINAQFVLQYSNPGGENDGMFISPTGDFKQNYQECILQTQNGKVVHNYLKEGNYKIYEVAILSQGYKLEWQDGYKADSLSATNGWVYLGDTDTIEGTNVKIRSNGNNDNKKRKVTLKNHKYVGIRGRVWQENKEETKSTSTFNQIYDDEDQDLKGILVYLMEKGTDKIIASTETNENGVYEIVAKDNNKGRISYGELSKYYVRFTYNNQDFINVEVDLDKNKENASRAKPEIITAEQLDDKKLIEKNNDAVTLKNSSAQEGNLAYYYNNTTGYVETINLGLMRKYSPNYSIKQELAYIRINLNGYTYTYNYKNKTAVNENGEVLTSNKVEDGFKSLYVPTTSAQNLTGYYSAQLYPSDIAYDIKSIQSGTESKLDVYAVYRITVQNDETMNLSNNYVEEKLFLNSLENTYDSNRYILATDDNPNDVNSNQFKLWSSQANNVAKYNVNADNNFANGIEKNDGSGNDNNCVSTYIQLKMKDDAKNAILNGNYPDEGLSETAPTKTTANAYHDYIRTDYVWNANGSASSWRDDKNNSSYTEAGENAQSAYPNTLDNLKAFVHHSINKNANSFGLFIRFKLGKDRTISGTVFEDQKTRQVKDENGNDVKNEDGTNLTIGDGIYQDGENVATGVQVELLNIDKQTVATLYTKEDSVDGHPASTTSRDNGTYELKGVVPGLYYLRFTYGNGEQKIKKLDGTEIEEKIDPTQYTSTKINPEITEIIQEANSKSLEGTSVKELEWYKNSKFNQQKYSVALDNLDLRKLYDDNYYVNNEDGEGKQNPTTRIVDEENNDPEAMQAYSPATSISIENDSSDEGNITEEDMTNGIQKNTYDSFSFGICKIAETRVDIEEIIKNVNIIAQNGSAIISQNPSENVSPYLTSLDTTTVGGSKYVKIEMDLAALYGANLEIEYNIVIKNNSERDYIENSENEIGNYFYYGIIGNNTKEKNVQVDKVISYIQGRKGISDLTEIAGTRQEENGTSKEITIVAEKEGNDKVVFHEKGENELAKEFGIGESITIPYEAERMLDTSGDDIFYESLGEIKQIKLNSLTTLQTGFKWKNDSTIFTLNPSTGKDKSNKYLIVAIIVLTSLSLGIIATLAIKKFRKKS